MRQRGLRHPNSATTLVPMVWPRGEHLLRWRLIAFCWAMTWCVAPSAMVIDPVDPGFGPAIVEFPVSASGGFATLQRIAISPQGRAAALALQQDGTGCYTA